MTSPLRSDSSSVAADDGPARTLLRLTGFSKRPDPGEQLWWQGEPIEHLVAERAAEGLGVIVSFTDVDDLIGVCTRVLVLREGRVALGSGSSTAGVDEAAP